MHTLCKMSWQTGVWKSLPRSNAQASREYRSSYSYHMVENWMSNLRKLEKFTVKFEGNKSTPSGEKLARMYGVWVVLKMHQENWVKLGEFGMSFVISISLGLGVQTESILWKGQDFYRGQRWKTGSEDRWGAILWPALNARPGGVLSAWVQVTMTYVTPGVNPTRSQSSIFFICCLIC